MKHINTHRTLALVLLLGMAPRAMAVESTQNANTKPTLGKSMAIGKVGNYLDGKTLARMKHANHLTEKNVSHIPKQSLNSRDSMVKVLEQLVHDTKGVEDIEALQDAFRKIINMRASTPEAQRLRETIKALIDETIPQVKGEFDREVEEGNKEHHQYLHVLGKTQEEHNKELAKRIAELVPPALLLEMQYKKPTYSTISSTEKFSIQKPSEWNSVTQRYTSGAAFENDSLTPGMYQEAKKRMDEGTQKIQ